VGGGVASWTARTDEYVMLDSIYVMPCLDGKGSNSHAIFKECRVLMYRVSQLQLLIALRFKRDFANIREVLPDTGTTTRCATGVVSACILLMMLWTWIRNDFSDSKWIFADRLLEARGILWGWTASERTQNALGSLRP
jgi:hypothetical protein